MTQSWQYLSRSRAISSSDSYSRPKMTESRSMYTTFTGSYQMARFCLLRAPFSTSSMDSSSPQMFSLMRRCGRGAWAKQRSSIWKNSPFCISPKSSNERQASTNLVITSLWETPWAVSQISLNWAQSISLMLSRPMPQTVSIMLSIFSTCSVVLLAKTGQFSIMLMRNILRALSGEWLYVMSYLSLKRCSFRNSSSVLSSSRLRTSQTCPGSSSARSRSRISTYSFFSRSLRRMQLVNRLSLREERRWNRSSNLPSPARSFLGWRRSLDLEWTTRVARSTSSLRESLKACGSCWQLPLDSSICWWTMRWTKECLMLWRRVILRDLSCSSMRWRQAWQCLSRSTAGTSSSSCVEKQIWETWVICSPSTVMMAYCLSRLQHFFSQIQITNSSSSSARILSLASCEGMQQYLTSSLILRSSQAPQNSMSFSRNSSLREMVLSSGSSSTPKGLSYISPFWMISRMQRSMVCMKLAVNSPMSCVLMSFLQIFSKLSLRDFSSSSARFLILSMMRMWTKGEQKTSTLGLKASLRLRLFLRVGFLALSTWWTIVRAVSRIDVLRVSIFSEGRYTCFPSLRPEATENFRLEGWMLLLYSRSVIFSAAERTSLLRLAVCSCCLGSPCPACCICSKRMVSLALGSSSLAAVLSLMSESRQEQLLRKRRLLKVVPARWLENLKLRFWWNGWLVINIFYLFGRAEPAERSRKGEAVGLFEVLVLEGVLLFQMAISASVYHFRKCRFGGIRLLSNPQGLQEISNYLPSPSPYSNLARGLKPSDYVKR